jgi:group I intron endonuclease
MDDKDCFGIIYKVTNIINGKIYIGQTVKGLHKRRGEHERSSRNGSSTTHMARAFNKYGLDNFKWEIIEKCYSKDELDEMEFHYIMSYRSTIKIFGYNCTFGGEGYSGCIPSAETRKKLSEAHKGRKMTDEAKRKMMANRPSKAGVGNPMYGVQSPMKGKNHTDETRNKISIKLSGKRFSDEHKIKLSEAAKIRWRVIKNGK